MTLDELRAPATVGFLAWWRRWARGVVSGAGHVVPCGDCRECCRGVDVELVPAMGDDPAQYATRPGRRGPLLQQTADGACVYLDPAIGCTIHARRPFGCRAFDCRMFPASSTIVLEPGTEPPRLTFTCEAGFRRFRVLAPTAADRDAMQCAALAVRALRAAHPTMDAHVACMSGLLRWEAVAGVAAPLLARFAKRLPPSLRLSWGLD